METVQRIIIIGATSGIGYEIARIYQQKGWKVGIAGRRFEKLKELAAQAPEQTEARQIDITRPNSTEELQTLIEQTGGMDIFLLCSGIGSQNRELNPATELSTIETNALGFTRMVTAAYHYFAKQGRGHLAVISSIAGTKGLGAAPSYSATKRFQNTYIDAIAQLAKMEKHSITFTDIRPGFVKTDLLKNDHYPLLMSPDYVARKIVQALTRKKRRVIIDWRYAILVFFWKMIPPYLWERLPIHN
ncbi:SDR family oxidoreductase [Parabacteroides sp. AM08-6]|uniref:SDR family NAD(P)-dependent oxidoreductase n=1 Tax=Parabacteroides sp. AM08-6 TaxID=2292053 RepID=UPI000EFDE614|nr:SDR family NAD(P)-dependent oxidoreductase [Parabacteroides sp. AM08-6]RHJ87662.1 SDR family NAD(P)-dependent oxidoreductase [Parabacteroides sp. AM08-6]